MKALLDEQLSPHIADLLCERGFDMVAVAGCRELVGRSDRTILELASHEERAVVTNNIKDFRPLAAERLARGLTHPGLILLPGSRTRTRAAVGDLAAPHRGRTPRVSGRVDVERAVDRSAHRYLIQPAAGTACSPQSPLRPATSRARTQVETEDRPKFAGGTRYPNLPLVVLKFFAVPTWVPTRVRGEP